VQRPRLRVEEVRAQDRGDIGQGRLVMFHS
jgi:hypothetical protein